MKIINTLSFCRFIAIIIMVTTLSFSAFAGGEPIVKGNRLDGSLGQIKKDSVVMVIDSNLISTTYTSENKVSLGIDESLNTMIQGSFNASVALHIEATMSNNSIVQYDTVLRINYEGGSNYVKEHAFYIRDAYKISATVTDVATNVGWNVWNLLKVNAEISSIIQYEFSCSLNAIDNIDPETLLANTDKDELLVSWPNKTGADEYDLEWTYVDSSALASGQYGLPASASLIFDHNASRVSVTETSYKIPLIYDSRGHLFFRVRSVQISGTGQRLEANWSSSSSGLGRFDYDGHERKLNWQATTTYAEEGKRKTVVQYFDGSLRNRQTVTKDNTGDSTTIVAETFYDLQGRPVIQVLPSPTLENVIKYHQNFNTGAGGNEYSTEMYDVLGEDAPYCGFSADSMSSSSGASRYYSQENPEKNTGIHRFIPDARKYPYTETQYTQDNTGRINKQGGVGPVHKIGGGHETTYYYGTPSQEEIDALFGTEVGHYSHYQKTVVKDANGQFSVSYMDMHGRTIATALAGVPTEAALDTLSSYTQETITETIADSSSAVIKDLVIESKKGLVVPRTALHTFNYELSPQSLELESCSDTVCYDCAYDLRITISGSCNNEAFGGQPFDTVVTNFTIGSLDGNCNALGFSFSFTKLLTEGSYEITKQLLVNRQAMDHYRDVIFTPANTCSNFEDFVNEQRTILANIPCAANCDSCKTMVGSWDTYRDQFLINAGITTDTASYTGQAWKAYEEEMAACAALCDEVTEYDDIRSAMLSDVSAPSGQYANIDSTSDTYSIFYGNNPKYKLITNYLDEEGYIDSVYDESKDAYVKPHELSPKQFAAKFKASWAKQLLVYHPEYCKLQLHETYAKPSSAWARRFEKIDTYAEAAAKGYLNPSNKNSSPFNSYNTWSGSHPDPDLLSAASGFSSSVENGMTNYVNTGISIWQMAAGMANCPQNAPAACYTGTTPFSLSNCDADNDMAWRNFRGMYLTLRKNFIDGLVANSGCNGSNLASTLLTAYHQPHFADATTLLDDNDISVPSNSGEADALEAAGRARMNASYDTTCRAYATQWRKELKGCYDSTTLNSIIEKMIEVCKNGADESHPFGSSTISPTSTYQYESFQEVLDEYSANTATCTADNITAPKPYNRQTIYSAKPIWTKPDSCECERVNLIYTQYQTDSAQYAGFSDYMQKKFQTEFSDSLFNVLRNLCSGVDESCSYLKTPISLPPVLQCYSGNVCANCSEVNSLYSNFKLLYPTIIPKKNPTDSLEVENNRLFENYLNNKFGFTFSTNEYLSFIDSCEKYATGINQIHGDTLQDILVNFTRDLDPMRVVHFADASSGTRTYDRTLFFKDGLAVYPVDTIGGSNTWYNTIQSSQSSKFCPADSFAIEYKVKFPVNANNGCCYTVHGIAGSPVFGIRSGKVYFEAFVNEFGKTYGIHHTGADTTYFKSIFVDSSEKVNDWNVISMKTTINKYEIYYNNALIIQIPRDSIILIPPSATSGASFMGTDFQMDYIKIIRGSKVLYFEDFINPYSPAKPIIDAVCATDYNCEARFASYFNSRSGTIYDFRQIDSIYYATTNKSLTVCEAQVKPCDSLKSFIKQFNVNANPYRVDHILQSNELVPPVYTDQDIMNNGYMRWSDTTRDNHQYTTWVYHQTNSATGYFCMENGFSVETRVKHLRNVVNPVGDDIIYTTSYNVGYVIYRRETINPGIYLSNINARLDSNNMTSVYSGVLLLDSNANAFLDWMTLKITVTPTHCRFYYNGILKLEVPRTSFPLGNSYSFTNAFYGYQGAMDWIKMYDASGEMVYFQDFDDPNNKAAVDPAFMCPPPANDCQASFVNYYNQQKGTTYTYNQIDSVYRSCGVALNVCGTQTTNYPEFNLCGNSAPVAPPIDINTITNCSDSSFFIYSIATELYRVYTDSLMGEFDSHYRAKCLDAYKMETFTVSHEVSEYHYTLYYYDQAGNLVKTIPPKGVAPNRNTTWLDEIKSKRALKETQVPTHSLPTNYRYNTLNQVVAQKTPDAGISEFWYDRLGRLALSQNARQKGVSETSENRLYSYTKYDYLGRITEVGQIKDYLGSTVDDALTRNQSSLDSWLDNRYDYKGQVTRTIYDEVYEAFPAVDSRLIVQQRNLRNRVSYTTFTDTSNGTFNQATFYSYDIHGNVDTLLQDYGVSWAFANVMNANGNRFKKIIYDYDLISGKVNKVSYQRGWADQMFHKYKYDAENRLTKVETSFDNKTWEQEAEYEYYRHGPLARMMLGQQKVQGIDYAYTLQGWLKGVNSTLLTSSADMGEDGLIGGANSDVARDAIGFHLNYYDTSDYSAISELNPFPGTYAYLNATEYRPLFNGNISSMAVHNRALTGSGNVGGPLMLYNYRYDQLNRLTSMDAYTTSDWTALALMDQFRERISYDGNGNILTYLRRGHRSAFSMDNLSYVYNNGSNQLNRVDDQVSPGAYGTTAGDVPDIDDQGVDNYTYDETGNLIKDSAEGITSIKWSVYGKILEINRTASASNPVQKIKYTYDAQGNRISKALYKNNGTVSYTWYVRDAQGNTMATYQSSGSSSVSNLISLPLNVSERHLYGSSRLGIYSRIIDVDNGPADMTYAGAYKYYRGFKQYELSNHLGNVLATITDKKKAIDIGSDGTIDYYDADITTAQDYYPFGMLMPGRIGYQTQGGWTSEPGEGSPGDNSLPADIAIDNRTNNLPPEYTSTSSIDLNPGFESGSDDVFLAYISEAESGSGGGSGGSGGSLNNGYYRYGFNGKENDGEVKGTGNQYDYGFRIYDPRISRFLSTDPLFKTYPWYTPYQFAGNKPIWATDLDGLEENTVSTYVYKPPVLSIKPAFRGLISISDATSQTAHKTFEGDFSKLSKADPSGFAIGMVNSISGDNIGNIESRLDLTAIGSRSAISKSVKGTDKKYFTQYLYTLTNNNITETGTFEIETATIPVSARVWDPLTFLILNKVVNSMVGTFGSAAEKFTIPNMKSFMSSATAESKNGLTAVGRALQKHAGREGSSFADIQFSGKTGNQQGLGVLNDILSSKDQIIKRLENGTTNIFDKATGRGVNISRSGEFNGFRDLKN